MLKIGRVRKHNPGGLRTRGPRPGAKASNYVAIWGKADGLRPGEEFVVMSGDLQALRSFFTYAHRRIKELDLPWNVNLNSAEMVVTIYRPATE